MLISYTASKCLIVHAGWQIYLLLNYAARWRPSIDITICNLRYINLLSAKASFVDGSKHFDNIDVSVVLLIH